MEGFGKTHSSQFVVPGSAVSVQIAKSDFHHQTIISAGDGAKAALQCYKYLIGGGGGKVSIDWQHKGYFFIL
jgi:alkyl hydroperoxide reductase subunit AhpF